MRLSIGLTGTGLIAEMVPLRCPEDDIASNSPATCVSYEWPLPYLAPHGRHYSCLSSADHAGWGEGPPGGKIGLKGEEGDSASRYPGRERQSQA